MTDNINTVQYWDTRFLTGDWEQKNGREQTTNFAKQQVKRLGITKEFSGTLLDFGCGLGDAFPIYHAFFPTAKLFGVDHSEVAIKKCKEKYGLIADFIVGDEENIPVVDVIITSNVFEHLSNYNLVAEKLVQKCKKLYIIVPYNEPINENVESEHINSFNEKSFSDWDVENTTIYRSKEFQLKNFLSIIWNIYIKNLGRYFLFNRTIAIMQIMYEIKGNII